MFPLRLEGAFRADSCFIGRYHFQKEEFGKGILANRHSAGFLYTGYQGITVNASLVCKKNSYARQSGAIAGPGKKLENFGHIENK
jgi:hypothetical protein